MRALLLTTLWGGTWVPAVAAAGPIRVATVAPPAGVDLSTLRTVAVEVEEAAHARALDLAVRAALADPSRSAVADEVDLVQDWWRVDALRTVEDGADATWKLTVAVDDTEAFYDALPQPVDGSEAVNDTPVPCERHTLRARVDWRLVGADFTLLAEGETEDERSVSWCFGEEAPNLALLASDMVGGLGAPLVSQVAPSWTVREVPRPRGRWGRDAVLKDACELLSHVRVGDEAAEEALAAWLEAAGQLAEAEALKGALGATAAVERIGARRAEIARLSPGTWREELPESPTASCGPEPEGHPPKRSMLVVGTEGFLRLLPEAEAVAIHALKPGDVLVPLKVWRGWWKLQTDDGQEGWARRAALR